MSRVLIDTNAYSALMAGDNGIADTLGLSDAVLVSPIVLGELLDGFRNGMRYRENVAILQRFRDQPRTITVPVTDRTAEWFGEIRTGLRARGLPIPTNDVWIAASCMEHGALLLTRDGQFEEIDGLRLAELDEH